MNRQDPVWSQMTQIESEGLASQQMQGNGVAGEGVQHEHVEVLGLGLAFQRQPRVAMDNFNPASTSLEKMKLGASNAFHVFVDFIELERISLTGIGGKCANAESDDTHSARLVNLGLRQHPADS